MMKKENAKNLMSTSTLEHYAPLKCQGSILGFSFSKSNYLKRRNKHVCGQHAWKGLAYLCSNRTDFGLLHNLLCFPLKQLSPISSTQIGKKILGQVSKIAPPAKNSHQSINSHVAPWHLLDKKSGMPRQSYPLTLDLSRTTTPTPSQHSEISQTSTAGLMPRLRPGGLPRHRKDPQNASSFKACDGWCDSQNKHNKHSVMLWRTGCNTWI